MHKWKQHWILKLRHYGVDHTPHCRPRAAARTHHVMAMFLFCSNIESTTRLWQKINLTSHFAQGTVACWVGLSRCAALSAVRLRMYLYGHPHLYTRHCNSEPSEWVLHYNSVLSSSLPSMKHYEHWLYHSLSDHSSVLEWLENGKGIYEPKWLLCTYATSPITISSPEETKSIWPFLLPPP